MQVIERLRFHFMSCEWLLNLQAEQLFKRSSNPELKDWKWDMILNFPAIFFIGFGLSIDTEFVVCFKPLFLLQIFYFLSSLERFGEVLKLWRSLKFLRS